MKRICLLIYVLLWMGGNAQAQALSGKEIFVGNCKACHSIGGGDIVGPDLAGVTERRDAEWIKSFIFNSQKMVAEGDETAVELFNKYNKLPMPSHNFEDEELNGLVSYLEEMGKEVAAAAEAEKQAKVAESEEKPGKAAAVGGMSGGLSWYVKVILALMGFAAVILIITAGYLYRIIKS